MFLLGLIGLFANTRDANAPDTCVSKHINMFIIVDQECGSILTNIEVEAPWITYICVVIALAVIRFVALIMGARCLQPVPQSNQRKEAQCGCCPCLKRGLPPTSDNFSELAKTEAPEGQEMTERSSKHDDDDANGEEQEEIQLETELGADGNAAADDEQKWDVSDAEEVKNRFKEDPVDAIV